MSVCSVCGSASIDSNGSCVRCTREQTERDIQIVKEWLYKNSQQFNIPESEWGLSLYNALARMLDTTIERETT